MFDINIKRDPSKSYYDYMIDSFNGIPVDEKRLFFDNDRLRGTLFINEFTDFRIVVMDVLAKQDFKVKFVTDQDYDYSVIFYSDNINYNRSDGKVISLNTPSGLVILKDSDNIEYERKKGERIVRVTMNVNKNLISTYLNGVLNKVNDFVYHKGDEQLLFWKNTFFNKTPQNLTEKDHDRWYLIKLEELTLLTKNILNNITVEEDNDIYTDNEFEVANTIHQKIIDNIRERPVLLDLAKEHGINSSKIGEIFKHCFGQTIYQFYKITRIQKVHNEIMNTNKTITDIAYEFGYTDLNHLSKEYKNEFGLRPSQIRKKA